MIQVIIPGQPQGKGRAKIVKIGGLSRMASPPKTVAYENLVALCAQESLRGAPLLDGPVRVRMNLWCQAPKTLTKRERADIASGAKRPTTKPDIDNVVKAVFDGFNGVLWRDDVQVVDLTVSKAYAPQNPCVVVNVEAVAVTAAETAPGAK